MVWLSTKIVAVFTKGDDWNFMILFLSVLLVAMRVWQFLATDN